MFNSSYVYQSSVSRKIHIIEEVRSERSPSKLFLTLRIALFVIGWIIMKSIVTKQNKQSLGYNTNRKLYNTNRKLYNTNGNYRVQINIIQYKWEIVEYKWKI
jgi:hypothetical protein